MTVEILVFQTFSASFQLVAAMNPCPCSFLLNTSESYNSGLYTNLYEEKESGEGSVQPKVCTCRAPEIRRYLSKIPGRVADKFDLTMEVRPQPELESFLGVVGEDSATVRKRVMATRARQRRRGPKLNSQLKGRELLEVCRISEATKRSMEEAKEQFNFTDSRCDSILRVARTIADMVGHDVVEGWHYQESLNYRPFDRNLFG